MGKSGPLADNAKRTRGRKAPGKQGRLVPPDYLSATAREYWELVVSSWPADYFNPADGILLEQYCESAARHREALRTLTKEGRKYRDAKGKWHDHPAVDDEFKSQAACAMLSTKLRITKQAQISPKVAGRKAQDGAEEARVQGDDFSSLMFNPDHHAKRIQ